MSSMLAAPSKPEQHIVIAEDELLEIPLPTYCCEFCGLTVKTRANLRAHHVKTHKILKNDADLAFFTKQKNQVTYVYHCPIVPCKHNIGFGAGFSTSSRLKQHYQNVHMQKSYKCEQCGEFFSTPANHAYHMRFCGKSFVCPTCSRSYSFKKHLDQHFRRSGHRPVNRSVRRSKHDEKRSSDGRTPLVSIVPSLTHRTPTLYASPDVNSAVPPSSLLPSVTQPTLMVPILVLPVAMDVSYKHEQFRGFKVEPSAATYGHFSPTVPLNLLQALTGTPPEQRNYNLASDQSGDAVMRLEFASQYGGATSVAECSTQTETNSFAQDTVDITGGSVSVNTGTDEDDISAFIGSLFCDASVETNFPCPTLVSDFTDTGLDALGMEEASNRTMLASLPLDTDTLYEPFGNACSGSLSESMNVDAMCSAADMFSLGLMDEGVQTTLLNSFEHVALQTDVIVKTNVAAATHDTPVHWNSSCGSQRVLDTPPPPPATDSLLRTDCGAFQTLYQIQNDQLGSVQNVMPHLSPISTFLSPRQSQPSGNDSGACRIGTPNETFLPTSHSVGLQSATWPHVSPSSSMQTQTLSNHWDAWLNSVHTQTSSSPFDLPSLADMCVGVDEEAFLAAALDSISDESVLITGSAVTPSR
ncbi:ATM interactor [Paragonimus westermani]|uniref:ATM interactor n=1 Tax=Paragonimus westermani TaxID=34504 RepID=A0A8T0DSV6_9TREM|nr:ATM interactor [Paragonimus westermani]